jgi:hypothetical protein
MEPMQQGIELIIGIKAVNVLTTLDQEISQWPYVSVHSHRFGGREFLFGKAEIGHIHIGGIVDIPFTRPIHDALLSEGLAENHRWVPNSGWITFRVRNEQDMKHALWLMRLSYLRYFLKTATNAREVFEEESEQLHLSPGFKSLFDPFIPTQTDKTAAEPVPA